MPEARAELSDADLISAWRRGDEWAATELVRRHAAPVARFLSAAGGGDDVDDLVQEAFFRAFRRLDTFRGKASFRTWVMTIGSNALKDLRRRDKRKPALSIEERDAPDETADPHSAAVARDLEDRLQQAVARLPVKQRDVFLLRTQQGVSYQDVAEVLGTTVGAARVHYHQAVKRLKSVLD